MGTPVRIISALNMELTRVVKVTNNGTVTAKNKLIDDLLKPLEAHDAVETNIMRDLSLNQRGQMERIKSLGTETTAPALSGMKTKIKDLEDKVQRLRSQFLTVDSGLKDVAERMPTFVYLWGKLDPLDAIARVTRFALACEANEVKTIAAMLSHPEGPMVDQETRERVLFERARKLAPQDFANFEQAQFLLEFLTTYRDWLSRWLIQEVGVAPSVIRDNFGDDALAGIPVEREPALTGAGVE